VLRDRLGLTGTKEGCNNGNCGACCVIMDGRLVNSCCVMGVEARDASITTIEGIGSAEGLVPLHGVRQDRPRDPAGGGEVGCRA
jgi:carbon-monoxide dehydrogenase small subunit